jgi:Fe-S cluster assembly scaffold protein SufB
MSKLLKTKIDGTDREKLLGVGFDLEEKQRSGSFSLLNDHESGFRSTSKGIELLPIGTALDKYPEIKRKYFWKLVKADQDEYTEGVSQAEPAGYFIRVKRGHKVVMPLQSCFFIKAERFRQMVHNIVIMEQESSLNIINGCATASYINQGVHIGVTEIFLERNAFLSYTMIHDWSEGVEVRPRTGVVVENQATFISNYISIKKSKITQMFPSCILKGKDSSGIFNSLIYAPENSAYDIGARVILKGNNSRAEVVSRTISGGGDVIARGELVGEEKGIRAHLECSGMLLREKGFIKAIPVLEARHPEVDMSHEASVGKIAEEEIFYLMSRGIPEDKAIALIVRGFLDSKILGLPPQLEREVEKTLNMLDKTL